MMVLVDTKKIGAVLKSKITQFVLLLTEMVFSGYASADQPATAPFQDAPFGIPAPTTQPASELAKINLAKTCKSMSDAINAGMDRIVDFTYPKVIEASGGRDKLINDIKAMVADDAKKGYTQKSVSFGDPTQVMAVGQNVYGIVSQIQELKVPNGNLEVTGAMLAISEDEGKTWTFVDTQPGRKVLERIIPDLPVELHFPEARKPVFTRDKQ